MEKSSLKEQLYKHGFWFKKKFGQNFITDTNLLADIVRLSGAGQDSRVLEIGAGGGTLTREIAKRAKNVIAFEIDRSLKPVLESTAKEFPNIQFIFEDFLKYPAAKLKDLLGENFYVIANLPYYITTPLVMYIAENFTGYHSLTVTVQEEMAQRLCAKEDTPGYGAVTASLGLNHDCQIVKRIGRNLFYPVPNVDSALIVITNNRQKTAVKDAALYKEVVKHAFLNRRKTLCNNLMSGFNLTRGQAQSALASIGIDSAARGETLSVADFAKLSDVLSDILKV